MSSARRLAKRSKNIQERSTVDKGGPEPPGDVEGSSKAKTGGVSQEIGFGHEMSCSCSAARSTWQSVCFRARKLCPGPLPSPASLDFHKDWTPQTSRQPEPPFLSQLLSPILSTPHQCIVHSHPLHSTAAAKGPQDLGLDIIQALSQQNFQLRALLHHLRLKKE